MLKRNILEGIWFEVYNQVDHKNLKANGNPTIDESSWSVRVQKGEYAGPGRYYLMQYYQRCPRNCCYDNVNEVLAAYEVANEIKEIIKEAAQILKESRTNVV